MRLLKRFGTLAACIGLAAVGVAALPGHAQAWWAWRGGVRVWIPAPGVVVGPPAYYYPPPPPVYYGPRVVYAAPPPVVYYGPPRVWVAPHWSGPVWVHGYWR
jgi:hypothetical protein